MRSSPAVLLLISCFFVKFARSQSHELLVEGQTGKLYLEHTVVPKENWYSVGRLYNISPKELTAFNQLALTQPLTIGQKLEIPLTAVNFSQTGMKAPAETLVPVYYIIQEKEWMYRISVNHNKVPIPSLEKWNNVSKDQIHAGMHLIVGYLKVKTALSALATGGPAPAVAAAETKVAEPAVTKAGTPAAKGTEVTAHPAGTQEAVKTAGASGGVTAGAATGTSGGVTTGTPPPPPTTEVSTNSPAAKSEQPVKGKEKEPAAVKEKESVAEQPKGKDSAHPEQPAKMKETKQPAVQAPVGVASHNGGAFKGDFNESGKSATGQAGTFKSTSGWQDGKYYALMNNAPVGTIVRVDDPSTGKSIYAKVLGQLPDMKESAGLAIRISNAAAAELGEGEGRFMVEVKY